MTIGNNYNIQNYSDLLGMNNASNNLFGSTNTNTEILFDTLLSNLTNNNQQNASCCANSNDTLYNQQQNLYSSQPQEETNINIGNVSIDTEKDILTLDDISFNFGNRNITISNLVINNTNISNNSPSLENENSQTTTDGTIQTNSNQTTTNTNNQTTIEQPKVESSIVDSKVQKAIDLAHKQLGKDYVWGANGPSSFDCSGLTKYLYKEAFGIDIPRVSYDQAKFGEKVEKNDLQPGDLVFFDTMNKGRVSHVGIYIGDNEFIHAANSKKGVIKSTLSGHYEEKYITARRPQ